MNYISTKFSVDSSSHFTFRVQTHTWCAPSKTTDCFTDGYADGQRPILDEKILLHLLHGHTVPAMLMVCCRHTDAQSQRRN